MNTHVSAATLTLGIVPQQSVKRLAELWTPIVGYLSEKSGHQINFATADNGRGIEEEALSKLFDPFYTTKPVGQGTGLGLAISYGIISDHHGEILVTSEPGQGSCFTISLPVQAVPAQSSDQDMLHMPA